jgi:hypothetical protein
MGLNVKKDVTSYDDLIDSLQLALKGFNLNKLSLSLNCLTSLIKRNNDL